MTRNGNPQPSGGPGERPAMQLNIEELIIRGAGPVDRRRLVHEVQAELSRLLAGQGLPPPTSRYPGPGETSSGSRKSGGDSVARQIARGIYQNLAGRQQGQT
jgi:hypothetical protein